MYLSFYNFTEKPFNLFADPDYLFPSSKHKAALAHLDYGLTDQSGFVVITGDVGTGKTTLLKHLIRNLDEQVQVAMVFNTRVSPLELVQMILREFDLDENQKNKSQCYRVFYDFFLNQHALGNRCLLIIDEAQSLSHHTLEEIRMLSNLNEGKDNLLQIILAGQPMLKLKLERKGMRQFAQRVTMDFVLEPLEADETRDYIVHRVRVAGRENGADLYTPTAYERIYQASRGIPRLINILCDAALVYGFADELNTIDANVIDEVLNDKRIRGQFYGNEPAREGPAKALSRKHNALSKRVEALEQEFKEFQDKRNDQTIRKLENLLVEEKESLRRATYQGAQKDINIKLLKRRIAQLAKRPAMKEPGPEP